MKGDNKKLRAIDEVMGWVEEDGSSPALSAEKDGVAGHILKFKRGLPVVAWESGGVWSYCVLSHYGLTTTLLAKSRAGIVSLIKTLYKRVNSKQDARTWQTYYEFLWENRYRRWCCTGKKGCDCQLHRAKRIASRV